MDGFASKARIVFGSMSVPQVVLTSIHVNFVTLRQKPAWVELSYLGEDEKQADVLPTIRKIFLKCLQLKSIQKRSCDLNSIHQSRRCLTERKTLG
jgi:hypothetical protein